MIPHRPPDTLMAAALLLGVLCAVVGLTVAVVRGVEAGEVAP